MITDAEQGIKVGMNTKELAILDDVAAINRNVDDTKVPFRNFEKWSEVEVKGNDGKNYSIDRKNRKEVQQTVQIENHVSKEEEEEDSWSRHLNFVTSKK